MQNYKYSMFLNAFQATLKKKIIDILHITCGTEFLSLIMFKYVVILNVARLFHSFYCQPYGVRDVCWDYLC